MNKLLVLSVALAHAAAFAYEWPSSGTATIPAGDPAVITDADVANVANLDAIVLEEGASVTAEALTSALTLKANVSGLGTLAFTDCLAGVTLTGDNSDLAGNFAFTNTAVTVASRHGLGSETTGAALFVKGASGTFSFTGEGLTNDVPLSIVGAGVEIPSNTSEQMVQNAGITFDVVSSGGSIIFRNVYLTKGTLTQGGARNYFYLNTKSKCTFRVGEDAAIDVGLAYVSLSGSAPAYLRIDTQSTTMGITQFPNTGHTFVMGAENVFPETLSYGAQISAGDYGLDLNGYDQTLKFINGAWYTESEGSTIRYLVKSEKPATLKFLNANGDRTFPLRFSGAVSFEYAGTGSYRLVNVTCDTTGSLTVDSGAVILDWNYGWNGTNVLVKSGATLDVNTPNAITSGKARLVVEEGGTLNLHGNNLSVESANVGGVELEKGEVYTAQWFAENCPGVTWLGTGVLTVMEDGGEFEWPTEPGAIAKIPMGKTVTVTDADLPKLAQLGGIQVKSLATLSFEGLTESWDLVVPLSGYGTVSVTDCARYAIVANNTNFLGHFEFSNTDVVVSNRFALGCAASEPTQFAAGENGHFRFMGGGLTNDVPLKVASDTGHLPYDTDETLVQNAGIQVLPGDGSADTFRPRNLTITSGLLDQQDRSHTFYCTVQKNCTLTIEPEAGMRFGNAHMQQTAPCAYVYNSTNILFDYYTHYDDGASIRLGAKDVFRKNNRPLTCSLGKTDAYGIDLDGFDQTLPAVSIDIYHYTPARGKKERLDIRSAAPATLTMTTESQLYSCPVVFSGAAGLTFAGSCDTKNSRWGSFAIYNQSSDTEGALTVESGTLSFKWDAGWFGTNVVVRGTGTLQLEDTAKEDFFNATTKRSRTALAVSDDGRIDLGARDERVGYLTVDGEVKDRGTYGGPDAGLDPEFTLDCIVGSGTITVERGLTRGLMLIFR